MYDDYGDYDANRLPYYAGIFQRPAFHHRIPMARSNSQRGSHTALVSFTGQHFTIGFQWCRLMPEGSIVWQPIAKHTCINMQQSTIMGWLLLPTNSASYKPPHGPTSRQEQATASSAPLYTKLIDPHIDSKNTSASILASSSLRNGPTPSRRTSQATSSS
jgi:hypothetical protein